MKTLELKYGKTLLNFKIDENNLYGVLQPNDLPEVEDGYFAVKSALDNPIKSKRLKDMAVGKKNIVILASDITRPSPSHIMIPPIIEELKLAGVAYKDISVIFGLGSHRKHTDEEKRRLVGDYIFENIQCIDHDINNCINLGFSKHGTPIDVFMPVAESDLIIATGNIELHYIAGYSGGNKALFPGVCSRNSIQANHSMMTDIRCRPGNMNDNPVREDIEEAGRIANVGFIVNAVLNSKKEIVEVVAGDPIWAHRKGVGCIDSMFKREIEEEVDIVIASCGGFPKDINLYQTQKGLEHANYAVKEGGSIILVSECSEGLGEKVFEEWMITAKSKKEPLERIRREFVLGGHKAAVICKVLNKADVLLVSRMDPKFVKEIFFEPMKSVQNALEYALKKHGEDSRVLILPYANSTLPCIK